MNLQDLQKTWETLGKKDPLWAVLTSPDKKGKQWNSDEFFASGKREIGEQMMALAGLAPQTRRKRALDFGCGVGRLTQALASYYEEVSGVDIAPSMIASAKEFNRFGDKCKYFVNDKDDLAIFENNTFDLIYTNITLQHIPPKFAQHYIKEFLRILGPGGVLVFQLPSEPDGLLRKVVFGASPNILIRLFRMVRHRTLRPMAMYSIPRKKVVQVLEGSAARVLDIQPNESAGRGWVSYRYYVTK